MVKNNQMQRGGVTGGGIGWPILCSTEKMLGTPVAPQQLRDDKNCLGIASRFI